jgi:hypothetical protein
LPSIALHRREIVHLVIGVGKAFRIVAAQVVCDGFDPVDLVQLLAGVGNTILRTDPYS